MNWSAFLGGVAGGALVAFVVDTLRGSNLGMGHIRPRGIGFANRQNFSPFNAWERPGRPRPKEQPVGTARTVPLSGGSMRLPSNVSPWG